MTIKVRAIPVCREKGTLLLRNSMSFGYQFIDQHYMNSIVFYSVGFLANVINFNWFKMRLSDWQVFNTLWDNFRLVKIIIMHSRLTYQSDSKKQLHITYIKNDAIEKIFKYVFFVSVWMYISKCDLKFWKGKTKYFYINFIFIR